MYGFSYCLKGEKNNRGGRKEEANKTNTLVLSSFTISAFSEEEKSQKNTRTRQYAVSGCVILHLDQLSRVQQAAGSPSE